MRSKYILEMIYSHTDIYYSAWQRYKLTNKTLADSKSQCSAESIASVFNWLIWIASYYVNFVSNKRKQIHRKLSIKKTIFLQFFTIKNQISKTFRKL